MVRGPGVGLHLGPRFGIRLLASLPKACERTRVRARGQLLKCLLPQVAGTGPRTGTETGSEPGSGSSGGAEAGTWSPAPAGRTPGAPGAVGPPPTAPPCAWRVDGALFRHDASCLAGFQQRDLSLPLMEKVAFAKEREHKRRGSVMDYETRSQVG